MISKLKNWIESTFKMRIYRNSMPHGADLYFDLNKHFGLDSFKTVFDVGANIGQSALNYINVFPKANIYSFEPVISTFDQLVNNTKNKSRITCFNKGMGKVKGKVFINVSPNSADSSILHHRPEDRQEMIEIDTLTDFCEVNKIGKIDYLKTDTEGFETEVLEGSRSLLENQQIRLLIVECAPIAKSKDLVAIAEISKYLQDFNYELFGIYDQVLVPDGKKNIEFFNALFVCPEIIANSKNN